VRAPAIDLTLQRLPHRGIVSTVVEQHAEDAAMLHATRTVLVEAGHVKLHQLARFDERLRLHLDGLGVAGKPGFAICNAALEVATPSRMFVASSVALKERLWRWLDRVFALAEALPECASGVLDAFGWVDPASLGEVLTQLESSTEVALCRLARISARASHRMDLPASSICAIDDPVAEVRARAWRAVGEVGDGMARSASESAIVDDDLRCRFWVAWAAVMLGDRRRALETLTELTTNDGAFRSHGLSLLLRARDVQAAHAVLKSLARKEADQRWRVRGAGIVGDPSYVQWLISLMSNVVLARLAGESFSLITGADLVWLDLERKPPEGVELGPNDDPGDDIVAMDEDEGLPWPDPGKVETWWSANAHRFQPGVCYFMGAPPRWEHCRQVLNQGYQRQRMAAAEYLCLLRPGTILFNCRAPAWRQQRWLARLQ
jgi:uncharacterized protein (TIGR02270 family)